MWNEVAEISIIAHSESVVGAVSHRTIGGLFRCAVE